MKLLRLATVLAAVFVASLAFAASPYRLLAPGDWAGYSGPITGYPGGSGFSQTVWPAVGDSLGSHEWDVLSAKQPWSISQPDPYTVRMELRQGDQSSFDAGAGTGSERDELAASYDGNYGGAVQHPPGPGRISLVGPDGNGRVKALDLPVYVDYGLTIEPGAVSTDQWCVISQLHEDEVSGSPEFSLQIQSGDLMAVWIGYTRADGVNTNNSIWVDSAPIVRGHRYHIQAWVVVDPFINGGGRLIVLRDGVKIVDYAGVIGYRQGGATGPDGYSGMRTAFWKFGLYRHGPYPDTLAADYDHMHFEWGSGTVLPTTTDTGVMGGPQVPWDNTFHPPAAAVNRARTPPTLTLTRVTGPFANDQNSYRAFLTVKAPITAAVAFTIDGRPVNPAQVTRASDGSATLGFVRIASNGTPRKVGVTVNGLARPTVAIGIHAGKVEVGL